MNNTDPNSEIDYDYGIISVKPQNVDYELPMDPITMMRNALGVEFGGSGIKLDFDKYNESVKFWTEHVLIKQITNKYFIKNVKKANYLKNF